MATKQNSRPTGRLTPRSTAPPRARVSAVTLWLCFGGALLAALLVYGPALNGPFVFDDYLLPFSNPNAAKESAAFWIGGVRPVLIATYWANFLMSGRSVFPYHLTNVILHVISTVLAFFVLERLFDLAALKLDRRWCAFFGAGLFLLHPLQTESVAYIAGRSEEVAGLFFLAAWLVFLNNFRSSMTLIPAMEILLLGAAAVLAKESAIALPAILFLTDLAWKQTSLKEQIRGRLKLYLPVAFCGLIAAAGILQSLENATSAGFAIQGVTPGMYVLTQCRVTFIYLRLFLIPFGQNGDWKLPFFRSIGDDGAWIYMLGILGMLAFIGWAWRRARLLSFGLLTFLLLLLPTSSVIPIKDAMAERRMYLPIMGLIVAAVWILEYLRPRTATLRVVTACLLLAAGALAFRRSAVWSSDVLLWQDSARKNPANSRAHLGLGNAYLKTRRCADAIQEFKTVERQDDVTDEMISNLAAAYQCNHQPDLALKELRTVVATHPSADAYAQIGYLESALGDADAAMLALNEAISRDPQNAQAYAYRGVLLVAMRDRAGAAADLQRSLQLKPGNPTAVSGMKLLLGNR